MTTEVQIPDKGPFVDESTGEFYYDGHLQFSDCVFKIETVHTHREMFEFLKSLFENFPEASSGCVLLCVGWDYEGMRFRFVDSDENNIHKIDYPMILKGFHLFWDKYVKTGRFKSDPWDAGNYDAEWLDLIVQLAIFGEVIYG